MPPGAAVAGASGLKLSGTAAIGGWPVGTLTGCEPIGTVIDGDASVLAIVSLGAGVGLVVELQPGFAKMNRRANTWMPTTAPKIFRIFMAGRVTISCEV